MKRELVVTHDGPEHSEQKVVVEGPDDNGKLKIAIDGRALEVDAKQIRPGTWSVVLDGHNYLVDLDKRAGLPSRVELNLAKGDEPR